MQEDCKRSGSRHVGLILGCLEVEFKFPVEVADETRRCLYL